VPSVTVRYIVDDVDAAIAFYADRLGFEEVMHPAPTFAMLVRGELRLVLSRPSSAPGGGQVVGDRVPRPGGWNRRRCLLCQAHARGHEADQQQCQKQRQALTKHGRDSFQYTRRRMRRQRSRGLDRPLDVGLHLLAGSSWND